MKRILVLFLALIMVLGVLAACGPKQEGGGEKKPVEQDKEADKYLPVKSYKGKTYTVLYRTGQRYEEEWKSDENVHGDVINDAIASRNQAVVDRYGVELDYESGMTTSVGTDAWDVFWRKVTNNTEDDTFQLIAGYTYRLAYTSTQGLCLNWLNEEQVPVVHLDEDWWDGDFTEEAQFRGCSYIATGPLSLTDMYSSACIYFNKTLLNEYKGPDGTSDLFTLVKEGNWTLDKLIQYAKDCTNKVEGAETDDDAIYGLASTLNTMVDAYIYASEMVMTERSFDANGSPTVVLKKVDSSNPILQLAEKLENFYRQTGTVKDDAATKGENDPEFVSRFCKGLAVFSTGTLASAKDIQTNAPDILYGVIPYPKFTAEQEAYHTYKLDYKTGFCIPRTVYTKGDPTFVGTITDALAYYSNKFVKPALYDKVLTHKNVQDKDSSEFVTMVINGGLYEFANIYAFSWGDQKSPAHQLRKLVQDGGNFSNDYRDREKLYKSGLEKLLKGFNVNDVSN